jgi:hypothetical protein
MIPAGPPGAARAAGHPVGGARGESVYTAPWPPSSPPIVLNDWTSARAEVKVGELVTIEYYVWEDPGRLPDAHC